MGDSRTVLIDSDAFIVLSGAGLLDEALALLGVTRNDALRLSALGHMLRKSNYLERRYSEELISAASQACESIRAIHEAPEPIILDLLTRIEGIDPGEAVLLATVAHMPNAVCLTGDKRALKALGTAMQSGAELDILLGRVVLLGQLWVPLIESHGIDLINAKVCSVKAHRIDLEVIFSSANCANLEQLRAAADSYLAEVRPRSGSDLLYRGFQGL